MSGARLRADLSSSEDSMNAKLLGPLTGIAVGIIVAVGCGGSSSDVAATDAGSDAPTTPTDSGATDSGTTDSGATDAKSDAPIVVPGTEQTVQYGSCATFTPCGGDPKGAWTYAAGGCLDAIDVASFCATGTITNPSVKVKGTVTINATTIDRLAQVTTSATVGIPKVCVDQIPIPAFRNCPGIETALKLAPPNGPGFDTATCTSDGSGGCSCAASNTEITKTTATYTATGNTITTGNGETYDYCISNGGNTFTYQETTAGTPQKATLVMTK
jgi:hypothetical protein